MAVQYDRKRTDIITDSRELKKLIVQRAKELNIHLPYAVKEAGMDWIKFKTFHLNSSNNEGYRVPQKNLLILAKLLGIDVRIQLVIKSSENYDPDTIRNLLKTYEPLPKTTRQRGRPPKQQEEKFTPRVKLDYRKAGRHFG